MGNEQPNGTSHHFIKDPSPDEHQQQKRHGPTFTKNGHLPISKQQSIVMKPSWQLARDASMDMLSRKATKLSFKQAPIPTIPDQHRTLPKKYPLNIIPVPGKAPVIFRVPRMPTEQDVLDVTIAHQLLCQFCEGPCIGEYARCRVCIKTYHLRCLYERGHVTDRSFSLPRMGKQDWSCPECADLTQLLNQDEINYLISSFEKMDPNKDGYIIRDNFLEFCNDAKQSESFNLFSQKGQDSERQHFRLMDSRDQGIISWSDFIRFYSCKLVAAKNKTELTTRLTKKELGFARALFLSDPHIKTGNERTPIVTKEHFNRVLYDLKVLAKKKYGGLYIDAVLQDSQYVDEAFENLSVISWDEFLRQLSVCILLNRSNYDPRGDRPRRTSLIYKPAQATVVSHVDLTTSDMDMKNTPATTPSRVITPDLSFQTTFRKYGKILDKLNQRDQQAELRRKQLGSLVNWSIVEDVEDENDMETPKLKPNARDERQTISEPWSVVKEMEHLRGEPLLITTTRIQMLRV